MDIFQLEDDIENMESEKMNLTQDLDRMQREALIWQRKVIKPIFNNLLRKLVHGFSLNLLYYTQPSSQRKRATHRTWVILHHFGPLSAPA